VQVSVDLLSKCNIHAATHLRSLCAAVSYALDVSPQLGSYEAQSFASIVQPHNKKENFSVAASKIKIKKSLTS